MPGFDAVSPEAIVAEVRVTTGAIYHHFPANGLFLAVAEQIDIARCQHQCCLRQRSKTNESIRPEEVFFFEKKNQKTLRRCRGPMPSNGFKKQKFFASFFQKRRPCFHLTAGSFVFERCLRPGSTTPHERMLDALRTDASRN